ncbi:ABC transporter substrate-binding protein [Curtobacterium ammoniigenes]|uniref:ABC transporter substrate-binding protein n=1 Tax=Curtobacterium ammoniigenes TaxID=395387 RepID=UPI000831DBF1|nr:extracellular solute-binding protein [Curtobacterium ammoniigenes]
MKKRSATAIGAGLVTVALALTGCSAGGGSASSGGSSTLTASQVTKAMNTPTTISVWTWVPGLDNEVAAFEKKYPKIKVDVVNAGQGGTEYTKLEAAIQAGKGAPDVVQLEYSELPSIRVTNSLLDLTPFGATSIKSKFTSGAWANVASNGGVWGVPQDQGPMTFMFRKDILAKAGITSAPATWAEFMQDAKTVKAKTGASLADFGPTDPEQIVGMMQQAGAAPFAYDGKKTVTINLTGSKIKQVADYLTQLFQSGGVSTDPAWTNDWYQAFAKGDYAGWVVGAWGPEDLMGSAANTSGDWTAAPLPQWSAGQDSGGNWGGSADAVMKTSKNPIPAYEFIKFLNSDPASVSQLTLNPKSALFPTTLSVLNSSSFQDQKVAFFGGQKANQTFAAISKTVSPNFQYLPFWNYAQTAWGDTVGKAITAHTDIYSAIQKWQTVLVNYAKQQGFTVKQ